MKKYTVGPFSQNAIISKILISASPLPPSLPIIPPYPPPSLPLSKAVAFLDPASNVFDKPLNYSIPALAHGTQLSMEKPVCCEPGHSYFHYYSLLACPKVLMNVTVRKTEGEREARRKME